jgi:NTP pyrophosphatase (non-canonical NTP hydrolase)
LKLQTANLIIFEENMNLQEYQEKALRTESKVEKIIANKEELNYVLGAYITVTEMMDALKKKIYYNNPKKYNEVFHELSRKLHYFTDCSDRHHDIIHDEELDVCPRLFHGILGSATESGELIEILQMAINGHPIDAVHVQEELGDNLWYNAIINDALKLNSEETMAKNIAKLAKRYPEKYDDHCAEHRDLDAERKELEK